MLTTLATEAIINKKEEILKNKYTILTYLVIIVLFYLFGLCRMLHKFNLYLNEFIDDNLMAITLSFIIFSCFIGPIIHLFLLTTKQGTLHYLDTLELSDKKPNLFLLKEIKNIHLLPFIQIYNKHYFKNSFLSLISLPITFWLFTSSYSAYSEFFFIFSISYVLFIFILFLSKRYMASINALYIPLLSSGILLLVGYELPGAPVPPLHASLAILGGAVLSYFTSGYLIKNSDDLDKQASLTVLYTIAPLLVMCPPTLTSTFFLLNAGFIKNVEVREMNTNNTIYKGDLILHTSKTIFIRDKETKIPRRYESKKYYVYRLEKSSKIATGPIGVRG